MKKSLLVICVSIFTFCSAICQTPIDVAESTLKIKSLGEEVFYYGFAEGDQIVFNFEEVDGKELKEVEIIELPESSKFMDYKTKKIQNKTISITHTGIYKFRFSNGAIIGRICKFKISRIPQNESTKNFNTSVYWRTVHDTTYTPEQERYLISSDTTITNVTDQVAKVHSQTSGNKTNFNFFLPPNTISWSYYIGVDQAGKQAFDNASAQFGKELSSVKIPGYGLMAALALDGICNIPKLRSGESIRFYFLDANNLNLLYANQPFNYIKNGNVLNDYSKMTNHLEGNHYVCLINDNMLRALEVTVKITAVSVNNQWGKRTIQKMHIASRELAYLKN